MTTAFVFPGQGSQAIGMGRELAEAFPVAKEVFNAVDDALNQNLSAIMFEGPEEDLTLTENAQPAIMAVSLAVMRVIQSETGLTLADLASHSAGHSLGEYSAYAAAGTFSLAEAARLLKVRGQAMQHSVPVGDGAMAVLIGLTPNVAEAVAARAALDEVCDFANDNAEGQVVVSGSISAVKRAIEIAKDRGAKRAMLLPVSAPFHCRLMAPAADRMGDELAAAEMKMPNIPIVANVTAKPVADINQIRRLLVEQVTGRVRWRESVQTMRAAGVKRIVEIGYGKVLSGLTRRISGDLSGANIGSPQEVENFIASLN